MSLIYDGIKKKQAQAQHQTNPSPNIPMKNTQKGAPPPLKFVALLAAGSVLGTVLILIFVFNRTPKNYENQPGFITSDPQQTYADPTESDHNYLTPETSFEDAIAASEIAISQAIQPTPNTIDAEDNSDPYELTSQRIGKKVSSLLNAAQPSTPEPTKTQELAPPKTITETVTQITPKSPPSAPIRVSTKKKAPNNPTQTVIDKLKINGILFSDDGDSKVMINSRVYSLGAVINRNPTLTIHSIEPSQIILHDESRRSFIKRL